MSYKLVLHVTKEGATILQSREQREWGGVLPGKHLSLASRVMAAVNTCKPFVSETEEEARRVLQAETQAQEEREKLARKMSLAQRDMCNVKVNSYAVGELMRALRDEYEEREVYLGRLQASAFTGKDVQIPTELATYLSKVLEQATGKEGIAGKAEATIICPSSPAKADVPPAMPE